MIQAATLGLRTISETEMKKPTWMFPALLVTGLAGLGGLTQAASAEDGARHGEPGHMQGEASGDYGWSGQRWRDDDRRDYGSREGRRGGDDNDCGPRGRGRGYGHHGRGWDDRGGHGMHHGYGRGHEGMGRGYDRRDDSGRGYDRRDDSDRGYGRHGGRHDGRGGPGRFGRAFDPAQLDSVKKEIGLTAAQEPVWTKYASTLKEVADARKARRDSIDRDAMRKMSPDDHRKFRDAMIEQRRKEQDNVRAAVDELVKSLDEKQAAIAREVLPGYAFGPGMRGAGMGWGGGRNR
jgi:hypothetical protein